MEVHVLLKLGRDADFGGAEAIETLRIVLQKPMHISAFRDEEQQRL